MSPRTPLQFQEIREEKRALIMNTALEHFAKEGYHNTTISHIAKHAGISKGLMYNYFRSKEELLSEIINRSMTDISKYFDPDHDGHLTGEEFELFLRNFFNHIRENLPFWRLFHQLLLQKDVREQFLKSYLWNADTDKNSEAGTSYSFLQSAGVLLKDYFIRKKKTKPAGYDPVLELNIFIYILEGFTLVNAYLDEVDDYYDKTIDRIIEIFK